MNYDPKTFTYGLELEYSDVDRFNQLPKGSTWNDKDYTIVNSSGISNDPKGILWKYGGEINTKPTGTIEAQIKVVEAINNMLTPSPVINYKSNLHVHIGVPGLKNEIASLKKLLRYITKYSNEAFITTDPIERPKSENFKKEFEYKGAVERFRRSKQSHHHMLPDDRVSEALRATTFEEFYNAHAPPTKNGKRAWNITVRPGINLRQLKETNTIEFRHFYGTLDIQEIRSCLVWCKSFVENALGTGEPPSTIIKKYPNLKFPRVMPYDHRLQMMWRMTTRNHNTDDEIRENIKKLTPNVLFVCTGNINRSAAGEIILNNLKCDMNINVKSAGTSDTNAGSKPTKKIISVLKDKGYNITDVKSQKITKDLIAWCDILFYMDNANRKNLVNMFGNNSKFTPLSNYSRSEMKIHDPHFQKGTEAHEKVVNVISECCDNYIDSLIGENILPKNRRLW